MSAGAAARRRGPALGGLPHGAGRRHRPSLVGGASPPRSSPGRLRRRPQQVPQDEVVRRLQVHAGEVGDLAGVAAVHGGEDLPVLLVQVLDVADDLEVQVDVAVGEPPQLLGQLDHPGPVGPRVDQRVEGRVGLQPLRRPDALGLHPVEEGRHLPGLGPADVGHRDGGDDRLDRLPQLVELLQLGDRQAGHHRAGHAQVHQALGGEDVQGVPDRDAADAVLRGDLRLRQHRPGGQRARPQPVAQPLGDPAARGLRRRGHVDVGKW